MKKLLFLLLLIPQLLLSQNSWFELEVQFDYYAPAESFTLLTQSGDTLVNYTPTVPFELYQTLVYADSGDVNISLFDSYGDGWAGGTQNANSNIIANITMKNACQGIILDLNANFSFYQYDTTVNLLPCPPPVYGCMDSNSVSYDPNATIDDGSCVYSVTFILDMNQYPNSFSIPEVNGDFNNWCGNCNQLEDNDGDGVWETTINIAEGNYLWNYSVDSLTDIELPAGVNTTSACFLPDGNGGINRTLNVDGSGPITLDKVCWESCFECGTVFGCTDSLSLNYNPWATYDNGSCVVGATCYTGQTPLEIKFTPDNFGSESSWKLFGDSGLVAEAPQGTYFGATPGLPISTFVCVDELLLYDIVIEDSYGDGLNGAETGGTINGNVQILDCSGTILYNLTDSFSNANFGYLTTSPQFTASTCTTVTPISGCMDPFSLEFNPDAIEDDSSCSTPRIEGCIDSTAFNYDQNANTSEIMTGNYTLEIFDGAADGWTGTWLGLKQGNWLSPQYKMDANDGSSISFSIPLNIYQPVEAYLFTTPQSLSSLDQISYKLLGPEGDTLIDVPYWGAIPFPFILESDTTPQFGSNCIPVITGCLDSTSFNYIQPVGDPLIDVNTDDGSCIPIVVGCMNSLAFNYNSTANVDDPTSCIPIITGCMDPSAFNYIQPIGDPYVDVNTNDSSLCIPVLYGCTDSTSFNYDPNANTNDGSCIPVVEGCTDPAAFNYDSNANTDDGSCIATVLGCIDPSSFNYNPSANTDDGSCIPFVYGCTDPTMFNYNSSANTDNGSCEPYVFGCMDTTMFNFNPLANTDDSNCIPYIYGCTDPSAFNYNSNANTEDFSCIDIVYGCMDPSSINYDSEANVDNGSCITAIMGCTDPNSYNYNPEANVSEPDSCLYDAGCITGPGEPYWLNNLCYAWVIDVDNYCCENNWDPVCQELYNYCEDGWPEGIDLNGRFNRFSGIIVYPNPTENILNIVTDLDIITTLYDIAGRALRSNIIDKQVDLSNLPAGIYFLNIIHENNIYNKRIIKE